MNHFDASEGVNPAQPYFAAFQSWEALVHERARVESDLARSYMELLQRYSDKCEECDREKRNAMIWEKEQRMQERELNSLKAAAVSWLHRELHSRRIHIHPLLPDRSVC
jgi:hypothetical protein